MYIRLFLLLSSMLTAEAPTECAKPAEGTGTVAVTGDTVASGQSYTYVCSGDNVYVGDSADLTITCDDGTWSNDGDPAPECVGKISGIIIAYISAVAWAAG